MMIVLDPSRVVLGCNPATIGGRGYTVAEYVNMFDAVAGINGGGFDDPNGKGNGGMPDSAIVYDGQIYCAGKGIGPGFVGIDENNILHVGFTSLEELTTRKIRDGCGYGPILVSNGKSMDAEMLVSGLNPRTAIGQRKDGAILLLVIDGRQPNSIGATYQDEADIMLRFGAVNAMNLDGGSSSLMWFEGEYINNNASVIGIRPIPTSFMVLKEGAKRG
jgi:exopolysaccharide biosynthesis protein